MRILITSLSGHRIDKMLADYLNIALYDTKYVIVDTFAEAEMLLVTNGLNDSQRSRKLVALAKTIPTVYFLDDHKLPTFEHMTTVSQYTNLGDIYFQISELSVFDKIWETEHAIKTHSLVYWGHQKPERKAMYAKYIEDKNSTMLIGEWTKYPKSKVYPYERNMEILYERISRGTYTYVFGDSEHNGVNIPLRIYEALMLGVVPYIDKELIGDQRFKCHKDMIVDGQIQHGLSYSKARKSVIGDLATKRKEVQSKLLGVLDECVKNIRG